MASTKYNDGRRDDLKKNKTPHDEASIPLDKDYAHFPPVPTKQIIKHLTKKLKKIENPNSGNNPGGGTDVSSSFEAEANAITNRDVRIVNDSQKVVNGNEESHSVGSGGAFEATEQVN